MAIYTNEDAARNDQAAREWDLARGERKRAFEREMKGNFQQNSDLQRQLQGTWRDRALEERALRGTFQQNADQQREIQGTWADRNKAENWRANLTSNTQIRGQDLAAQTARYGTDSNMIEGAAQRSFMDRIYRMQNETQRGSQESLGKDRRLKLYSDAWLNLQDDAFRAFPDDEAKRAQYMQQGRRQIDQLFPEFGKPKPALPGGLEFGGGGAGQEPGADTPSRAPYNGGQTVNGQGQSSSIRPRRFTAPENMGLPTEGFESTGSPYSVRKGFFSPRERVPSTYRDPITGMDMQGFEMRRRGTPAEQTRQPEPSMFKGMIEQGNIDLYNRPRVKNQDGSISTVRSIGVNVGGKEILIPTVSDEGRILNTQEAVQQYKTTGKHLGIFDSPQSSSSYAIQLHNDQDKLYSKNPSPSYRPNRLSNVEPSMDGLTRRTLQMYDLPQSNATDNAMTVLNGDQRPLRKPIPKPGYQGSTGWDEVRRRTGGF